LAIILVALIFYPFGDRTIDHRGATTGIILEKKIEDFKFYILIDTPDKKGGREKLKVLVQEENTWNLIEVGKEYFMNYYSKKVGLYILEQIKIYE